ncbi:MAG: acyl-CoA dehydratase activase-related protein [Clostridia bacterium]|nr:acyl-CoA dehydratase activase-related protein [Clostridia bacterium]
MKIGIPRGLLYYLYFPLWDTFFKELGADVVISAKSNKAILTNGAKICASDACIPLKLFHGHVLDLANKVDAIFVPRLKSVAHGEYICPKFCGLPDMVRYSAPSLPRIIDTEVNIRKKSGKLKQSFEEVGKLLTSDKKKIVHAAEKALFQNAIFRGQMLNGYLASDLLQNRMMKKQVFQGITVAVLGHVYNVYDNFINMNLFKKMYDCGINAVTPEMISDTVTDRYAAEMPKKIFWTFSRKLIGAAKYWADSDEIDGVIYIMSFGCGIDSFTADLCERIFKKKGIPFYIIVIDEHSGEGGFETRFEAFADMLKRRKRNESDFSAYGEHSPIDQNAL